MTKCPICGSNEYNILLERNGISAFANKLFDSEKASFECRRVDLKMRVCKKCGLLYNEKFDSSIDLYDVDYNNSQAYSNDIQLYMNSSMDYIFSLYKTLPQKIVEIGCGRNASYLCGLSKKSSDLKCYGYDPAFNNFTEENDNVVVYPRYFDVKTEICSDVDLLVCRHMIEHTDTPLELLKNVHGLKTKESIAFFETPDASWILKNIVPFDFPYEHCCIFSPVTFRIAASKLGISVSEIKTAFNGQYQWVFLKNSIEKDEINLSSEVDEILKLSDIYTKKEKIKLDKIACELGDSKGKTVLWGAGAKGNTVLNMFDREKQLVNYVVDISPKKHGKYIAGTKHKIYSPDILKEECGIQKIIIMNSAYENEIRKLISKLKRDDLKIVILEE